MRNTITMRLAAALVFVIPLAACGGGSDPAAEHGEEGACARAILP